MNRPYGTTIIVRAIHESPLHRRTPMYWTITCITAAILLHGLGAALIGGL